MNQQEAFDAMKKGLVVENSGVYYCMNNPKEIEYVSLPYRMGGKAAIISDWPDMARNITSSDVTMLSHIVTSFKVVKKEDFYYKDEKKIVDLFFGDKKTKVCSCGGTKLKTTHSRWCDLY